MAEAELTAGVGELQARSARGAPAHPMPRAFSEYRTEYAYVVADLRRVALVVGALLAVLILLWVLVAR